jgi:hypothetical protein
MYPNFLTASEVAEQSLDRFSLARMATREGNQEDAKALLKGIGILHDTELYDTLRGMEPELALVAEGTITLNANSWTLHFASAHEAVAFLWEGTQLLLLNYPDLPERPALLHWFDNLNTPPLRPLLIRERSRLLATGDQGKAKAATPEPSDKSRTKSLDVRALALFFAQQDWTKRRIAQELGCNVKSLTPQRCPKLASAIAAWRSRRDPDRPTIRGSKDKHGRVEAWEDEG